jgi:hypothetical protein
MPRLLIPLLTTALVLAALSPAPAGDAGTLKPTNLGKVNTAADEDDPFVTADGGTLYYASNIGGPFKIFSARRTAKGFGAGTPVQTSGAKDADERSPFALRDRFYFATNAIPDEKFKDAKNYDIKVRVNLRAPLILPGISEPQDELFPWVTAGGKEFYFSRKTKDGWKLFVARGPTPGPIGDAKEVGFPAGFHHASLSANGLTMYLQGPLEKDRWGLFRSTRKGLKASWSKPEPLNTLNVPDAPRGDLSPCLSADGARLYFASDRPGGKGGLDLWFIPTAQLKKKK